MSIRLNVTGFGVLLAVAVLGLSPAGAPAAISEVDQFSNIQDHFDGDISNTDLINRGQASFVSNAGSDTGWLDCGPDHNGVSATNDGAASNEDGGATGLSKVAYYTNGPSSSYNLIFNLNLNESTGGSSTGYNITSVSVLNGWGSYIFYSDQIWTLAVATVAAPSTYVDLYSVNYIASDFLDGGDHSSLVTLTGPGPGPYTSPLSNGSVTATGIASLRFTVTASHSGVVTREIDVLGVPTPEPASAAVMLIGAGIAIARPRKSERRRS